MAVKGSRGPETRCFVYVMGPIRIAHEAKNSTEPNVHLERDMVSLSHPQLVFQAKEGVRACELHRDDAGKFPGCIGPSLKPRASSCAAPRHAVSHPCRLFRRQDRRVAVRGVAGDALCNKGQCGG